MTPTTMHGTQRRSSERQFAESRFAESRFAGSRQLGADALLLLVTLVWGSTFVMVKDAVASYPVFPFLTLRFGLATVVLLAIGGGRLRRLGWRGLRAGVLIGLWLFGGYALQTIGLQYTSASKAGFITGLSVALVPILSTLLLRRPPPPGAMIGVCLATVGLALLTLNHDLRVALGDLIVLGCAVSFALHIVSVSAFAPTMDPLGLTIVQVATVTVLSAGISLLTPGPWPTPGPSGLFAAVFTGILATAAAFAIQTSMQRFTTPTHTALIFAGEPVFAAVFGVLLAGDVMTAGAVAGGALIVVGTVVSEIRWSERTAAAVSRFLSPHYVAIPLLLLLGFYDVTPWYRGLMWVGVIAVVSVAGPILLLRRELRRGAISDWHISDRRERLRPVPVLVSLVAALLPLGLLLILDGPRLLLVAFQSALLLVLLNHLITTAWKISQHVSSVAASTTLVTATLGIGAAPVLLLVPLVAWARVKVGAHTVAQTVVGGVVGSGITLAVLRLAGVL
jgi:drug/metabolite transporter (DMT)-like permease